VTALSHDVNGEQGITNSDKTGRHGDIQSVQCYSFALSLESDNCYIDQYNNNIIQRTLGCVDYDRELHNITKSKVDVWYAKYSKKNL
jgi:hypothetical protein